MADSSDVPDLARPASDEDLADRVNDLRIRLLALPAIYISNALYPPDLGWPEAFAVNDDGTVTVVGGIDALNAVVREVESLYRRLGLSSFVRRRP